MTDRHLWIIWSNVFYRDGRIEGTDLGFICFQHSHGSAALLCSSICLFQLSFLFLFEKKFQNWLMFLKYVLGSSFFVGIELWLVVVFV